MNGAVGVRTSCPPVKPLSSAAGGVMRCPKSCYSARLFRGLWEKTQEAVAPHSHMIVLAHILPSYGPCLTWSLGSSFLFF